MADSANGRYKLLQKIGEGVHGIVLKAQDLTTGNLVAIKKVSLRSKHGEISLSTIREIKALQHCDCQYVSLLLLCFYFCILFFVFVMCEIIGRFHVQFK